MAPNNNATASTAAAEESEFVCHPANKFTVYYCRNTACDHAMCNACFLAKLNQPRESRGTAGQGGRGSRGSGHSRGGNSSGKGVPCPPTKIHGATDVKEEDNPSNFSFNFSADKNRVCGECTKKIVYPAPQGH